MRLFTCPECGSTLAFDNLTCGCGAAVFFDPAGQWFLTRAFPCKNRVEIGCNWAAQPGEALCHSCAMTEVIPDAFQNENRSLWAESERAKRWVLANLGRWGWFSPNDPGQKPVFHLMSEDTQAGEVEVIMGHELGVVTINVTEANPAESLHRRLELGESYRTMIGHYRHELAHFLFERLKHFPDFPDQFRAMFGDERFDYAAALERYYRYGAFTGWDQTYVTPYASSHPHEDWAESASHLLHLTDITDSFAAAGLVSPSLPGAGYDPYAETDAGKLITIGIELGIALNHVNRSMGINDIYPFVLTPAVRTKLMTIHRWLCVPLRGTLPQIR